MQGAGGNVALKFTCSGGAGAFVNLQDKSTKTFIESSTHAKEYMLRHHDRWVNFATSKYGLDRKPEEFIMVSGFVKTSAWSVAAYRSAQRQTRQGTLSGKLGPIGEAGFEWELTTKHGFLFDTRYGPADREQFHSFIAPPSPTPSGKGKGRGDDHDMHTRDVQRLASAAVTADSNLPHDQCIFLSYYKIKRRLWGMKIVAKAEDKDLSGDEGGETEVVHSVDNPNDLLLVSAANLRPNIMSYRLYLLRIPSPSMPCSIIFWG